MWPRSGAIARRPAARPSPACGSRPIRVTPPPPGRRWLRCCAHFATKAPHNKLTGNILMARHFPILPPCSWPSRPSLRRLVQPVLTATCARRRTLRRVGAEGWSRSNKRIGPFRRSRIAREASWTRKKLLRICTTEGNGTEPEMESKTRSAKIFPKISRSALLLAKYPIYKTAWRTHHELSACN